MKMVSVPYLDTYPQNQYHSLTILKNSHMGMRKKNRTQWKKDRKIQIKKMSQQRHKKALKQQQKTQANG